MSFGGSFQSGLVWGSMFMVNMLNQPKTSPTHNEKTSNKSREMIGSMLFCVELDNLKDTDAPIHQPAAMLVAAD